MMNKVNQDREAIVLLKNAITITIRIKEMIINDIINAD